jgi:acyl-coenzyme A synthetase/AMP-(fatty) acid ligase
MLYDTWRDIARTRARETALWDLKDGRRWRFHELAEAAESARLESAGLVCPRGMSVDFLLNVLRAWRSGQPLCPLEPGQPAPELPPPPAPCCHLKLTSATTGAAKAVAFTAEQLAADADNIVETMGLRPEWPNLGAISLAHSYGFSNLVLPLLLRGIPLILAQSPLPEMLRAAAAGHDGLTLPAVPALWRAWHEANVIPASVRLAISAGAPLTLELEHAVYRGSGLKIHNFYGSTECGGIAFDRSDVIRSDEACVGSAMKNVQLSIAPDGCLEVRGKAVGTRYWPAGDDALGAGVFRAADVAELQADLVYLRGRLGDQINVAGRKVAPQAIESVLRRHPAVRDCLVFAVPEPCGERLENIVACVVAEKTASPGDLRTFMQQHVPAWQMPRDWWFVDSLPATERGKVSRADWARRYLLEKGIAAREGERR